MTSSAATLLDSPALVDAFLASIADAPLVAVDTEGASFHRFFDRIWLIQVATRDKSALLDPIRGGPMAALGAILKSPAVEVVLHDAANDLRMLRADYGFTVSKIFDTRIAAQLLGIKAFGLASLLEEYFDVKLSKKQQRADWSMRPLTAPMLAYAAEDTAHLLALRDRMRAELEAAGRLAWAEEEFASLEVVDDVDDDARTPAFLRITGANELTRAQLTLLRELVSWREELAKRRDKAPFRIIGNEQLLALAHDPPSAVADLARIKGASPALFAERGTELVDIAARVRALPESELASFPRVTRVRDHALDARVAKLKVVRDAAAAQLHLDPGFLCGRGGLEAIAAQQPRTLDALALIKPMRGWKIEAMGAQLLAAISGAST